MLALIIVAIKRRRAQALLLVILGTLAATAAAAAPGYIAASNARLASFGAERSSADQQLVRSAASTSEAVRAAAVTGLIDQIKAAVVLPGYDVVTDVRNKASIRGTIVAVTARDGLCDQIEVEGACDLGPGKVVLDSLLAARLDVTAGSTVRLDVTPTSSIPVTVAGTFSPKDPRAAYWSVFRTDRDLVYAGRDLVYDPAFAGLAATVLVDQFATADAFRRTDPQLLAQAFELGAVQLSPDRITTTSGLRALADRIWGDQQFVLIGVLVGAFHLLLLAWMALFLAVRHTADSRRSDVALAKMRGVRRRDLWVLIAGQSVLPIVAGGLLGIPLGMLLARAVAGPIEADAIRQQVALGTVAAAAFAVLGAVIAGLVAERQLLAGSVAEIARRVPGRRRLRAGRIIDSLIVLVAGVATYITLSASPEATAATAQFGVSGVGLMAPILVGLAAGVLCARLVPLISGAIATPALRSGRVGLGLTAVHLARRRTMTGAVAMTVLALSVLCGTAVSWDAANRAQHDRAAAEVGADRVLLVAAPSRGALLAAVHAADPAGRYAMAAVEMAGLQPVLAVDATRLAAVAAEAPYSDRSWAEIARDLRPPEPYPAAKVTGTTLLLDATWRPVAPQPDPAPPAAGPDEPGDGESEPPGQPSAGVEPEPAPAITADASIGLITGDGRVLSVRLGPLAEGRHTYRAAVEGCAAGCRVVGTGLASALAGPAPLPGSQLVVHGLTQDSPSAPVLTLDDLTDRAGWRTSFAPTDQQPILTRVKDGLVISVGPETVPPQIKYVNVTAYRLDSPLPLPVVLAGEPRVQESIGDARADTFGYPLPIDVAATATAIPRLGSTGILMDLTYADQLVPTGSSSGTSEVWLTADAPDSLVDSLRASGIRIFGSETRTAQLDLLAAQGPTIVLRFLLLAAIAGAVLALLALVIVATVERPARAQELRAMRQQGLAERVVWQLGAGGYLVLSVIPVAVAVVVAVAMRPILHVVFPLFSDSWSALAAPEPRATAMVVPVLIVAAALVTVALVAGRLLIRAVRRPEGGRPG